MRSSSSRRETELTTTVRAAGLLVGVLVFLGGAAEALAVPADAWLLSPEFGERARGVKLGQQLVVEDVPLEDPRAAVAASGLEAASSEVGPTGDLRLRRIQVFRSGSPIVLHRGSRTVAVAAPDTAYFAGTVDGRPGSFAFLAVSEDESTRGLVSDGVGLWHVGSTNGTPEVHLIDPSANGGEGTAGWGCNNESGLDTPPASVTAAVAAATEDLSAAAAEAGGLMVADVALETDGEFHDLFPTTQGAIDYVGDLFAAISAIYERDVGTVVRVSHLSLWPDGEDSDPWVTNSSLNRLYEFRDEWRVSHGDIPRTVAHYLSGKRTGGGVAYVGVLCSNSWGYGFTGSIRGQFSMTNPSLFWDIMGTSHELGHNFGSGHTHCYSPPVDHCYDRQSNCYDGTPSVPTNGGGSIMSYCHLRSGGYSNINLWLGREGHYGDDSQRVPDLMRSRVESAWCIEPLSDPPTVELSATPAAIDAGEEATLSWTTDDADQCAFVDGIREGGVGASGALVVRPAATNTYEIECTGPGGTTMTAAAVDVARPQTTVTIDGSTLRVVGPLNDPSRLVIKSGSSGGEDYVDIIDRRTEIVPPEGGPCAVVRKRMRCEGTFTLIDVVLGNARDRAVVRGGVPAHIDGGGDDDVLRGGSAGDTLVGGPGRDRLFGRGGNDDLQGGDDDDRLDGGADDDQLQGGLGADVINGRSGTDTVVYVGRSGAVSVTFDDMANDGEAGEGDNVRSSVEQAG